MLEKTKKFIKEANDVKVLVVSNIAERDSIDVGEIMLYNKMLKLFDSAMEMTEEQAVMMDNMNSKLDDVNCKLDKLLNRRES